MQTKTENPLPKIQPLPGAVCVQWRRCGKGNCRCRHGSQHGPYYFLFWREGSTLRKRYIRRGDAERMQEACQSYREQQAQQRRDRDASKQFLHTMRKWLRELEGTA